MNNVELPKISVILPNYNGGKTIEKALKSVFDQNYENLEVLVVDGASNDASVSIIQKFESKITWWISEPDTGQSNAINKGFQQSTGEIITWLCTDDMLAIDCLKIVAEAFRDRSIDVVVGQGLMLNKGYDTPSVMRDNQEMIKTLHSFLGLTQTSIRLSASNKNSYLKAPKLQHIALLPAYNPISQPSCFYRRRLIQRHYLVDESYNYIMDAELWTYFKSRNAVWKCLDSVLSIAIQDGNNKTSTGGRKILAELERLYVSYSTEKIPLTVWHRRLRFPLEQFIARHPKTIWLYPAGAAWLAITLLLAPFYGLDKVWFMRWKRWA
ncbi:MAG: glycosyltransferase [Leptolyngbya sp. UWPOB_LEPTO1]|uniref:glycosyltransferase family 2 protein n=1 Tax=Leptolyngbya sp. UWPOB_LEPTO1 TaxID=2815653 RepID=UPI001ACAACDA|nr:glycosyltransferase family 2 protein [Leptolyngbya sp. UWPOB_LEPTO1]MBN8560368.1 glycosyltransferase [Leptolyngbya sp. UWPOB_LEPTO1]